MKKLMKTERGSSAIALAIRALCLVLGAELFADGVVPSVYRDIGTVGSDRVLRGGCVYEVTTNCTFEGTKAGESGLIVAEGQSAYIHIARGATLTCVGGSGADASNGGDGQMPRFAQKTWQENEGGIKYEVMDFKTADAGEGANRGGGGGGAGILVPANSSLTVFGEGVIVAKGGAGGAGGAGGTFAQGAYHMISWFGCEGDTIDKDYRFLIWSNRFDRADFLLAVVTGKATRTHCTWWYNAQPASGGGGGGGAGGGGAGIGTSGTSGGVGGSGGTLSEVWDGSRADAPVEGTSGAGSSKASGCGVVRIALPDGCRDIRGGKGGDRGVAVPDDEAKDDVVVNRYNDQGEPVVPVRIYMYNGRAGGGGGAGGSGAPIGAGGSGGAGGGGGYGGGIACDPDPLPEWTSTAGTKGAQGDDGELKDPERPPVILKPQDGLPVVCDTLTWAVEAIVTNAANYGATLMIFGRVTGENAKVPSGTTVVVEKNEYFREPGRVDLRQPYYLYPVPCDTNGDSRTYHYTFNTNLVVPVVSAFGVEKKMASLTVTNVCKGLYYRPLVSTTPIDFKPEPGSRKKMAVVDGPLDFVVGAMEETRFYRVGVTDDPR